MKSVYEAKSVRFTYERFLLKSVFIIDQLFICMQYEELDRFTKLYPCINKLLFVVLQLCAVTLRVKLKHHTQTLTLLLFHRLRYIKCLQLTMSFLTNEKPLINDPP